jgi:hypothetical protein
MRRFASAILLAAVFACVAPAHAQMAYPGATFSPIVPISALAAPASWLDPSRLHVMSSVSVGSGSFGTSALQVTSLSYAFRAPVSMSVSVGNAWGPSNPGGSKPFLEGLNLLWQPSRTMMFQVRYQDFRSPLQYGPNYLGTWGR